MNTEWNESDTGYIMVGNISYPREHHNKFKDYPPAPYKRPIQWEELPAHVRKSLRNKAHFEAGQKCPYHTGGTEGKDGTYQCKCRLITDLNPHEATLHVRLLKHYLEIGCEFKIQKVIRFGQSEVLRSYIDLNASHRRPAIARINELTDYLSTRSSAKERVKLSEEKEKRCQEGKDESDARIGEINKRFQTLISEREKDNIDEELLSCDFDKQLFKDMSNIVYGKTMQNIFKQLDMKMVRSEEQWLKAIWTPFFQSATVFNEGLAAVISRKKEIKLDQPIGLGFAVTQLSKLRMSEFVYNVLYKAWPGARMMATDTDSTYCLIETEDYHQDILKRSIEYHGKTVPLRKFFDHSNYPKASPWHYTQNEGLYGTMKHDEDGVEIHEWRGLKSKMKTFRLANGKDKVTAKGIPKNERAILTVDDYRQCNAGEKPTHGNTVTVRNFRSDKQVNYLYLLQKAGLNRVDTKRNVLPGWKDTVPFGFNPL